MTAGLRVLIAAGCVVAGAVSAQGQNFPSKTITIVVPAAPGGVTDALGRVLAQRFTEAWGQQAVVENRAGANNQIAAEHVTKSAPDGHTLFIAPEVTFVVNPSLYPKLPYDPVNGFTPITGLVSIAHGLIANPALPVQSARDLIELAKKKPGELNYGTFGVGSSGHLNMEYLQSQTGVKFTAVHYKGATPALTDVMAGHIQMMFISVERWGGKRKGKRLGWWGGGAARVWLLLPGGGGGGGGGFRAVGPFFGCVCRPAGGARPVAPEKTGGGRPLFCGGGFPKDFLDRQYFESIAGSPQELAERLKVEEPKWRKVIQDAKVQPE